MELKRTDLSAISNLDIALTIGEVAESRAPLLCPNLLQEQLASTWDSAFEPATHNSLGCAKRSRHNLCWTGDCISPLWSPVSPAWTEAADSHLALLPCPASHSRTKT